MKGDGGRGGASWGRKHPPSPLVSSSEKFYSITLVFICCPFWSCWESDARLTGRLRLAAMPCCGRTAVIFLMNLNGLVAVTHFAEEERNFASNDD